jgi:hypothetical protein
MEQTEHFRMFFWQKFIPLLALPVLAAPLAVSPLTDGWALTTWAVAGALVAAGVGVYLVNVWRKSDVVLDDGGMTLYIDNRREVWPYGKLIGVKQVGQYRVRMCYDVDRDDGQHLHISVDFWDSDGFTDALLDRYAESQGHELDDSLLHAA